MINLLRCDRVKIGDLVLAPSDAALPLRLLEFLGAHHLHIILATGEFPRNWERCDPSMSVGPKTLW